MYDLEPTCFAPFESGDRKSLNDGRRLGQEFADAFRQLGADAGPVVDAVTFEQDSGGAGAGIVGSDDLDGAAVAGPIFFDDDDAIVGLFTGADAGEADHQHG